MSVHPYRTIDVFTAERLRGNPLAVVFEAVGLSDTQMQDIARWINLSETTFLLLDSAETVLSLEPDHRALAALAKVGVIGAHAVGGDAQFEVRGFVKVTEDTFREVGHRRIADTRVANTAGIGAAVVTKIEKKSAKTRRAVLGWGLVLGKTCARCMRRSRQTTPAREWFAGIDPGA